jgi:hypothetical protein
MPVGGSEGHRTTSPTVNASWSYTATLSAALDDRGASGESLSSSAMRPAKRSICVPIRPSDRGRQFQASSHVRAWRPDDAQRPHCAAWGARRHAVSNPPSHATARVRIRPGACRPRYAGPSGVARPSQHPAHGSIHRAVAGPVQGFLARTYLSTSRADDGQSTTRTIGTCGSTPPPDRP